MPSVSAMHRVDQARRSLTWPSTTIRAAPSCSRGMLRTYMSSSDLRLMRSLSASSSASSTRSHRKAVCDSSSFENELDENPDAHFLSPVQMYEYEDWASDSDGDGDDEVAWDAGITDFALFDSDRRRAQERHEGMPGHWESLLTSQAKALQRAVDRNRTSSDRRTGQPWTPLFEDVPQLTPDHSPNLKDHLDMDPSDSWRSHVPHYLSTRIASSANDLPSTSDEDLDDSASDMDYDDDDDDDDDDGDYDTPVAVLLARSRERQRQSRRSDRPGLRFSRTMSGKVHVWRRPSMHIYPVGEDVEAEHKAEMLSIAEEADRGL